jgi:predicted aldo/keto reductase-like oxidoreductase
VNVIDTADVYSSGASEEIIGRALNGRRDRVAGLEHAQRAGRVGQYLAG